MVVKERDEASTHCDELKKMLDELIESQKAKVLLELEVLLLMQCDKLEQEKYDLVAANNSLLSQLTVPDALLESRCSSSFQTSIYVLSYFGEHTVICVVLGNHLAVLYCIGSRYGAYA